MNVRYGRGFKWLRKIAKFILSGLYPIVIRLYKMPIVHSVEDTVDVLLKNRLSICRFGDSEFLYIVDRINLPYQKQVPNLREKLIEILQSDREEILVGLPVGYYSLDNLKRDSRMTWRSQIAWIYPRLSKILPAEKEFFNASMTRPYIDYEDTTRSADIFRSIMKLWENRDILMIEGEKSRLGVGNDLFASAKSVKRILGPAHNAYDKVESLITEALNIIDGHLVLVAMGPTAKVIVYELAKRGNQAIDIGNLDIEYEWFLRGSTTKVKIAGKYTSEAKGGRDVDDLVDNQYQSEIVSVVN